MSANRTFKEILRRLEAIGITKAVAGNMTYDGTPCVILRWNGVEEYVSLSKIDDDPFNAGYNENFVNFLKENYADENLI